MRKSIHLHNRQEHTLVIASVSILILALLMISPATATVNSWEVSPENPTLGDTLRIKGSASPGEEIEVQVTFEKAVPVSGGKYEYILEDVKIPEGFNNRFTVRATEAKNLNVRVKMLIWITKSSDASGNTATVTQSSVPPGTYQIKMDGDAAGGASTVNLKITAVQQIKADSSGDFSYSYNTKAVPPGDFKINVGGVTKQVTLKDKISVIPGTSGGSVQETEDVTEKVTETPVETENTETENNETENNETVSDPDQNVEQEEENDHEPAPVKETGLSGDIIYMGGGMVAGVLMLILYSKRK